MGEYTDIAVDSSGNPHITYQDVDKGALKYATKQASGDWLIRTVDPNDSASTYVKSIALDSLGNAHISYVGSTNLVLKYASRTSLGKWHTKVVDNRDVGTTGTGSSIIVDSDDDIHISYNHIAGLLNGGLVRYATTSPLN